MGLELEEGSACRWAQVQENLDGRGCGPKEREGAEPRSRPEVAGRDSQHGG